MLWSLGLSDRKRLIGLPKKRADVILFGAVIYEASLHELGFADLRASTRGLRYAALLDG
jgi:exopolyphosphatase/pppGpp-phosphohydrolase